MRQNRPFRHFSGPKNGKQIFIKKRNYFSKNEGWHALSTPLWVLIIFLLRPKHLHCTIPLPTLHVRLDELPNRINIKGKKKCPFSYITLYALGLGLQI